MFTTVCCGRLCLNECVRMRGFRGYFHASDWLVEKLHGPGANCSREQVKDHHSNGARGA